MRLPCSFVAAIAAAILLTAGRANAEPGEPAPRADEVNDVMSLLAAHGLHDLTDERWNAYGQFTWISAYKAPFSAAYTNLNGTPNSLSPLAETSFTGTLTAYLAARLWHGAEIYEVPELISERPLTYLRGLGGVIQNFELQKTGSVTPTLYNSRLYIRQTIGLGGEPIEKSSDPMQLGRSDDRRRIVLTVGNFSILDMFDRNAFSSDARKQFLNMAFMTYAAYDFAADARGYAWGGVAELYYDDWALRFGRITPPQNPNQLPLDFRLYKYYGDQAEIEHAHRIAGREGVVRVLGYRNRENMGRFDDAIAAFKSSSAKNATDCSTFTYAGADGKPNSTNASAPDLCWARKPNVKLGIGIDVEQRLTDDIGVFFRGMYSDGQTEVYSYTSTDRSISLGALAKGSAWRRARDTLGVGYGQGWISQIHAEYLNLGGADGFIGDGRINQASEHVFEIFYSVNLVRPIWLTADYQHIWNPGYNADRGPVDVFGWRMHAEF